MKSGSIKLQRALTAMLGSLLLLQGCGGYTSVDVGGSITNLSGSGLVLANGTSRVTPAPGAVGFVFPDQVAIRSPYAVTILTQPSRQTCAVFNPNGTAGATPVTIVSVLCDANTYAVGGTVSGLTGAGLVLTNGSDQIPALTGDASGNAVFTFPTPVADGATYGVAVLTQPAGQTCTVANGTAVMGAAPVTNVAVSCR
jgi:hypothetical protein